VDVAGWWKWPALRLRRFDAAAGGRRWQGSQTFGAINAEVNAAAGPVRRRASYYARNNPWIGNGVSAIVERSIIPALRSITPIARTIPERRFPGRP